jgi:type II secretory pathway component PulL
LRAWALQSLVEVFAALKDRRSGHGLRHRQRSVLACAALATLMGASGYQAYEDVCSKLTQRQLRALRCAQDEQGRYYAPSDSTFFRVINQVDAAHFEQIVGAWLVEQEISVLARLAVDGKVLRGSRRGDGKPLQLLSAVSHRLRLTLAQVPIEEKSNEIPALQPLLRSLPNLEGSLITADAMHCQQESSRFVTQELGADYLWGLKGNQSGVLEKAQRLLAGESFFPSGEGGPVGKRPSSA